METFEQYLLTITDLAHRARMRETLDWVGARFPALSRRIAWSQPMFTDHGTFIVGFSTAKKHMALAPERACVERFSAAILGAGYTHTNELVRIPWDRPLEYALLGEMIAFNIEDKAHCNTFWRK
jgi:uncharacterized protein YdhG (YjbR/CyaY superfamily)